MYTHRYRGQEHMKMMSQKRQEWLNKQRKTYTLTCPKCGKQFTITCTEKAYEKGNYRKYCSRSCANSHVVTEEHKQKLHKTFEDKFPNRLRNKSGRVLYELTCQVCGQKFWSSRKQSKCCSRKCVVNSPGYRENLRKKALDRVANGTHKGWNTRNITSYAEKFWVSVLENNNIDFTRELKFDKYFLDFYIEVNSRRIDLEIDGKQHERQKEHDLERDLFLKSNGLEVYRIPWNNINTDEGKQLMEHKIQEFLKYIK